MSLRNNLVEHHLWTVLGFYPPWLTAREVHEVSTEFARQQRQACSWLTRLALPLMDEGSRFSHFPPVLSESEVRTRLESLASEGLLVRQEKVTIFNQQALLDQRFAPKAARLELLQTLQTQLAHGNSQPARAHYASDIREWEADSADDGEPFPLAEFLAEDIQTLETKLGQRDRLAEQFTHLCRTNPQSADLVIYRAAQLVRHQDPGAGEEDECECLQWGAVFPPTPLPEPPSGVPGRPVGGLAPA